MYGFVKQSGGHVKIYSEDGQGTTVSIYLPRFTRPADSDEPPAYEMPGRSEAGEVILVVEDDEELRSYLTEALRSLGYSVLASAHAQGAIVILSRNSARIDLMLTDVVMPGMNGRELGRHAQEIRRDSACCTCQATRVTPSCIKVGLMTGSSYCRSQLRKLIWRHGSEMCWIGRQQVATSHSNETDAWFAPE